MVIAGWALSLSLSPFNSAWLKDAPAGLPPGMQLISIGEGEGRRIHCVLGPVAARDDRARAQSASYSSR